MVSNSPELRETFEKNLLIVYPTLTNNYREKYLERQKKTDGSI